jgi:hypothetical protein
MKPYAKADCKTCGAKIEWLKGLGWMHVTTSSKCRKPIPVKGTIE